MYDDMNSNNTTFFNMVNNESVTNTFAENLFNISPLYDAFLPSPLDTMDESTYPLENVLGGDFTLYPEENDPEEQSGPQSSSTHPQQTLAESPNSSWSQEDALGSPAIPPLSSGHSEDQGNPSPIEDLNALAERRLRENDGGKRRRKLSASNPTKRSRVEKKAAPERKSGIRRPRKPTFFCRWKECQASFTRQREFEMHMGKHEKPLFFCDICQQLLTRKDNRKKHDESKRHRENLQAHQANLANSPVLSSTTASSCSSPPNLSSDSLGSYPSPTPSPTVSISSSLEDLPLFINQPLYPDVGNQHIIADLSLDTEAKVLMLQAKIAAIGKNAEALDFEIREVLQEMEIIRREA
ncbi:hypothetical protein TWF506_007186 [Arthrobotrys conoides]|uniref:Matrin-type domain-containing protein n=1 Tax=Arthrobotrys conoides TaxID=74498 RepID=A0AAN8PGW4_9PEZI